MAERSWPYDAGNTAVLEREWQLMAREWLATGVIPNRLNRLAVTADGTTMSVTVASGLAWVEGFFYENDAAAAQPIAAANATNPRIDRVVVRLDRTANTARLAVLTGTPATSPTPPALTQTDALYELLLADVTVPATAGVIRAEDVVDRRTFTTQNAAYVAKAGGDGTAQQIQGFTDHTRTATLPDAVGSTLDTQNVANSFVGNGNRVRLIARLARVAAGFGWETAALDLLRITDAASQAFVRFLGDRIEIHSGRLVANDGIESSRMRERQAEVFTEETTTSTAYTNLPTFGPAVVITAGSRREIVVHATAQAKNDNGADAAHLSFQVVRVSDGAVVHGADDADGAVVAGANYMTANVRRIITGIGGLTPGVDYRVELKYRSVGGSPARFIRRRLIVQNVF